MSRSWTTEPYSDLYAAVQSAAMNRDQIDSSTLFNLQELFDAVFIDLCELTAFPPKSAASRETLTKKGT